VLVVIFGAGASYDSVDLALNPLAKPSFHYRPPLAKELFAGDRLNFEEAIAGAPAIIPILGKLRRAARDEEALEEVLERLEHEALSEFDARHKQLLAVRVYLQRIITQCGTEWRTAATGNTHYDELVDEVERWRRREKEQVTYITFNYDTMLEAALGLAYGWQPATMDSYIDRDDFWVLKPHGSVNWSRLVDIDSVPPMQFVHFLWEKAGRYTPGDFMIGTHGVGTHNNMVGVIPALAVPIANKRQFEFPQQHLERLRAVVTRATKVITIGWRGAERHFLELWSRRNDQLDLYIVSGEKSQAVNTNNNLNVGGLRSNRIKLGEGGFGDFLGSGDLRTFLEQ
jgi:hypothetical protein